VGGAIWDPKYTADLIIYLRGIDAGFGQQNDSIMTRYDAWLLMPEGNDRTVEGRQISSSINTLLEQATASALAPKHTPESQQRQSGWDFINGLVKDLGAIQGETEARSRKHFNDNRKSRDFRHRRELERDALIATRNTKQARALTTRRNLQTIPGAGSDLRQRANTLLFPENKRKGALT
jgi:hypothetical protein